MMQLDDKYDRDDFITFLTNTFLPEFKRDIRPVAQNGLSAIEKAFSLGKSDKLGLQIFEFQYSGSSKKRVTLTKEAFKIMQDHASYQALGVFYGKEGSDWRLSLMLLNPKVTEKGKVKIAHSNPRRYSYFLGPNAKVNTPHRFLIKNGQVNDINDLQSRFNVEIVTKEFFENYKKLYDRLVTYLNKDHTFQTFAARNGINTSNFAKKLLGQIVFIYFLQRKGWLGAKKGEAISQGDKDFVRALFNKSRDNKQNFFNTYLEPLFYSALNKPAEKAGSYYRSYFDCQIPFLNGGLFEPPQNYDWEHSFLHLPDKIFSKDPKNPEHGDGILDTFDLYNFTVDEGDAFDKEVSVDPEMLGKVFENLLEENLRKGKGTYYTPREIVHYMCQESLINYLQSEVNSTDKTNIEDFVRWGEMKIEESGDQKQRGVSLSPENADAIESALRNIKIVDPACGSGAFLVGMLQEVVKARIHLSYIQGRKISEYDLKKEAIQNSIFGVDIDPGAVEIAKLRLWLSLVVDYELDDIEPLPNLDYKIMQGNSLLEELVLGDTTIKLYDQSTIKKAVDSRKMKNLFEKETMVGLFDDGKEQALKDMKRLQLEYFTASDGKEKKRLREQIEIIEHRLIEETIKSTAQELKNQMLNIRSLPGIGLLPNDIRKLEKISNMESQIFAVLDELKRTGTKPFFLWHLYFADVFEEKGGFDIVIANPPYIDSEGMVKDGQKDIRERIQKTYQFTKGNWDIYIAFFELAFKSINENGVLTFITPDKWISKSFGDELRMVTIGNIYTIVKAGRKIFESAKVDSILTFISKRISKKINILDFYDQTFNFKRRVDKDLLSSPFALDHLFSDHLELLVKIEKMPNRLSELGICENACATSDAYKLEPLVINSENDFNEENQLKIINTGTISKYSCRWGVQQMTYLGHKYLNPVVEKKVFFELFRNSYALKSVKPKIIMKGLNLLDACIDLNGTIIPGKSTLIITNEKMDDLKVILAIINSKLSFFFIKERYPASSYNQGVTFTKDMVNKLPIPILGNDDKKHLYEIVNEILLVANNRSYFSNNTNLSKVDDYRKQIDQIIYKLYNLTTKEISIVEGGLNV